MELITVDLAAFSEARRLAHHLVQPLAGIGTALVEPQSDDGHTTLRWHAGAALVTQPTRNGVVYGLDLVKLEAIALGDEEQRVSIEGWPLKKLWNWFRERSGVEVEHRDYGEAMPPHPVADEGAPIPSPSRPLRAFAEVTKLGFELLEPIARADEGWSPVRTWPHHFDTATIRILDPDGGPEEARSVNVGLSPGDGSCDEPYLYVTPWPAPDVSAAPSLPGSGRWNDDGFTAAVIAVASHDRDTLESFLSTAVPAAHALLARA